MLTMGKRTTYADRPGEPSLSKRTCSYQCPAPDCDRVFERAADVSVHAYVHSGDQPHACDECHATFRTPKLLARHQSNVHAIGVPEDSVVAIESPVSPTTPLPPPLPETSISEMDTRINDDDDDDDDKETRPFACDWSGCESTFKRAAGLREHRAFHIDERPYRCTHPGCAVAMNTRSSLVVHQRVHTGERPYRCADCGQRFTQASNLAVHRRRHTGEMPFTCRLCNTAFTRKETMLNHVRRIHDNDTRSSSYRCQWPECSDTTVFRTKTAVAKHVRVVHRQRSLHECSQCRATYTSATALKIHERVHTGERPYKCSMCREAFSQQGNYKRHLKSHAEK